MGIVGREVLAEAGESAFEGPTREQEELEVGVGRRLRPTSAGLRLPPAVNLPAPLQHGETTWNWPRLLGLAISGTIVPSLLFVKAAPSCRRYNAFGPILTVPSLVTEAAASSLNVPPVTLSVPAWVLASPA